MILIKYLILFFTFLSPIWTYALTADFAIYNTNETQEVDGVWKEEVSELKKILPRLGYTFVEIGPIEIMNGKLMNKGQVDFKGLIMPGGYSAKRYWAMHTRGPAEIRKFIENGGNYLGFCAGAYYSAKNVRWAETSSSSHGNRREDYYHFPNIGALDLLTSYSKNSTLEISNKDDDEKFQGPQGPFGWSSYEELKKKFEKRIEPVSIEPKIAKQINLPMATRLYYFSGPYFQGYRDDDFEIWARAIPPKDVPEENSLGANQPTIIRYQVDKTKNGGNVILSSYHPVMTHLSQSKDEIYQSMNLLSAMLQVASNHPMKPLQSELLK